MPQYKYQVRKGVKWMAKFNYLDPKTGKTETEYKRGFDSKQSQMTLIALEGGKRYVG